VPRVCLSVERSEHSGTPISLVTTTKISVLKPRLHDTTCCQTGCQNTDIQPVVKPVSQPVGCLFTRYSRLWNGLYRLYRVNGVLEH